MRKRCVKGFRAMVIHKPSPEVVLTKAKPRSNAVSIMSMEGPSHGITGWFPTLLAFEMRPGVVDKQRKSA